MLLLQKKYVLFGWDTGNAENMAGLEQITVLCLQFVCSWQIKEHSASLSLKAIKLCTALRAITRPSGPLVYCIG